jgi:ATP-dependent RNA helicase RhlE
MNTSFESFNLETSLLEAIGYMGFKEPTEIQQKAIPEILKGSDILATAQTGTGKTASFVLPVLDQLIRNPRSVAEALVIVPTRELALQIDQQLQAFTYFSSITTYAVYGGGDGDDWNRQKNALTSGTNIIIATPGKLLSHLGMSYVDFSHVRFLVLDEADRMLDMGFYDDITKIISHLPKERQNLMFSATMPSKIRMFANGILKDPVEINLRMSKPAEGVIQGAYAVSDDLKSKLLSTLIKDKPDYSRILIFTSTRRKVSHILRALRESEPLAKGISSDLDQDSREQVLLDFKSKKTRVVVATDVLSRGIDIKAINLVINYDVPGHAEDYVHRIGRTARADTTGVALTFVNQEDMHKFFRIEKLIERSIPKLKIPPEIGTDLEWIKPSSRKKRKPQQNRKFRARTGKKHQGRSNTKA